jgi:hypothetical protein
MFDLAGEDQTKELPIIHTLHSFFSNKENELEFKFDELFD